MNLCRREDEYTVSVKLFLAQLNLFETRETILPSWPDVETLAFILE